MKKSSKPELHFIRKLCAHLDEAEIAEAEASFLRYLEIVRRIQRHRDDAVPPTCDSTDPDNGFKISA